MNIFDRPEIVPLGATAMLARFGDAIDRDLTLRLTTLVRHLDDLGPDGLVDLIPSYTTLLAIVDPERLDRETLSQHVVDGWGDAADRPDPEYPDVRTIEIPVVYGGEAGLDLGDVARHTGLDPDEVIRRHCAAEYTVGALGFSPGFAFLIGLPSELATPRRATPRTRIPAGSVGIAGPQTGVYSLPTPGGWQLIGRTPRRMFDPKASTEDELRPGDAVRFVPTAAEDAPPFHEAGVDLGTRMPAGGAIEIVEPGVQASVQDLGRPGQGRIGVTPGGALDRSALVAGNRLLGNPDGAATIEWTLLPPAIRFREPCRVALTGADPGWRLGDRAVVIGEAVEVSADEVLRARPAGGMSGARGYLCVAGGIDVPEVRGSRSLDLSAGFGGGFGRPLRSGDRLPIGEYSDKPNLDIPVPSEQPGKPEARPFRVVRGPQADRFGAAAWRAFLSEPFTIDAQSNRMGLRLSGPAITPEGGADIVSEGVVTGAVQVTGSGQPIVLLPGRATIGGYTKIATVIEADHDLLGQLPPGATIRFAEVSLEGAEDALRAWRPAIHGGLRANHEEAIMTDGSDIADAWTPDGVIRVIREIASQDVRAFSLRVESPGLEIAIDRGGGMPGWPRQEYRYAPERPGSQPETSTSDNPILDSSTVVAAPLLGTFWRKPSPEEPNFVEPGDRVEPGQTVGLIEVMKGFHEVTASEAGTVRRVLVEDGAAVEYGQPLVELDPVPEG